MVHAHNEDHDDGEENFEDVRVMRPSTLLPPPVPLVMSEERKQIIIGQMQRRIIRLRHASECEYTIDEPCPVLYDCAKLKNLWRHIIACGDDVCVFENCIASRRVLAHYSVCTFISCRMCSPLRETAVCEMMDDMTISE